MSNKYKILLVDDEQRIRSRICSQIMMHDDFEIIGEASNGVDALELIESTTIDIVITDIRMPYSDGIELTRQLRRQHPKIKVAFISGYDDFQYAKEAIDLDVVTYLQKPVTADDITDALAQIKKTLDAEQEIFYNEQRLEATYQKTLPLLIENQFNALLQSDEITNDVFDKFALYNIDLKKGEFAVAFVSFREEHDFQTLEKMRVFLINLIPRLLKRYTQTFHFNTVNGLGILINHAKLDKRSLEDSFREIMIRSRDYHYDSIAIGVSDIFRDFKVFSLKFKEATEAVSYVRYLNASNLLFYADVSERAPKDIHISEEELKNLEYAIKFGTKKELETILTALENHLTNDDDALIDQQYYVIQLASLIMRLSASLNVELNAFLSEDFLKKVMEFNTFKALLDYVESVIFKLRNHRHNQTKSQSSNLGEKIVAYVDAQYHDHMLNMDAICDKFHISASYLSVLFKKHTGTTFNRYLIQKRMEKAKELLINTNMKILEIAEAVGYHEVYHFSHSFKKIVSVSPKEYRNAQ